LRRWIAILVVALALALIVGRWSSTVYANWQWYAALGALPVYRSSLVHVFAWRAGATALAFGFAFLNLYALRRSIVSLVLPRRMGNIEIGEAVSPRLLLVFVTVSAAILGVLLSGPTGDWTTFALARIAEPFRDMDPYLDRDLSFVMAWLPFEFDLYDWAGRVLIVVTILIIVLYALTPSLRIRRGGIYVSAWCRRHLATLAALGILLLAWRWRLDALTVTVTGADPAATFGAYEHKVAMPFFGWLSGITGVLAFAVFWGGWHGYARVTAVAGLIACLGGPLVNAALPRFTERQRPATQRADEERSFASTRRLFTRRAFGVDEILLARPGAASTGQAVAGLTMIPIWDPAALARTVAPAAAQDARGTIAWSAGPGGLRATAVMGQGTGSRSWTATTFDATAADERGRALPALPTQAGVGSMLAWSDLLVYPGAKGVAIVDDTSGHLPSPSFSTVVERVAHAWSQRSPGLASAERPPVRPRIVSRRDATERVAAMAPFFVMGGTVTPLLRGDSLYWVAELFSTSRFYPLSDRIMFAGAFRPYAHHAATAFVHAGTGRVTLIAADRPDGITRTWMRRFPWLFGTSADVPAEVWAARPPGPDWAALQSFALARTGVNDRWPPVRLTVGTDNADADLFSPTPSLFAVDSGANARLGWSVPLVDSEGIVSGVVTRVATGNGLTRWIGATREERWSDILDRLQRAADSAGVGGKRRSPRRGRVVVVPTGSGLLYVQAHYEWPTDAAPVLAGVAIVSGGIARAGATASEALGLPATPGAAGGAFRSSVDALYRRMNDALRRGDWPAFGSAFTALGQLLRGAGR
jgi:uncharacterized membrane protein (UPF0182 family)